MIYLLNNYNMPMLKGVQNYWFKTIEKYIDNLIIS